MLKHSEPAEQGVFTIPRSEEGERMVTRAQRENCGYRRRAQRGEGAFSRRTQPLPTSSPTERESGTALIQHCITVSNSSLPHYNRMIHPHPFPLPWDSTEPSPWGRAHFLILRTQTWGLVIWFALGSKTLADVIQAKALNIHAWSGLVTWHLCPLP